MNASRSRRGAGAKNTAIDEAAVAIAIELIEQRQLQPPKTPEELVAELKTLLTGVRNHAGEVQDPDELVRSLLKHLLEIMNEPCIRL